MIENRLDMNSSGDNNLSDMQDPLEVKKQRFARAVFLLRSYCHEDACKNVNKCPERCVEKISSIYPVQTYRVYEEQFICTMPPTAVRIGHRLGLDTAMAWTLADMLENCTCTVSPQIMKFAMHTLQLHFDDWNNQERYRNLGDILYTVYELLRPYLPQEGLINKGMEI